MATTLAHLNACPPGEFIRVVGPVFEHSPWIAESVAAARPFNSCEALHAALRAVVLNAGGEKQLALIRAHPDLVGRAVLTIESTREQTTAGLMALSFEEEVLFERYNTAYQARFGFPFVICARKNKKEAILRAFPERLKNSSEQETAAALEQIFQIAALRLADLIP